MRILHVLAERGFSGGEHQLAHLIGHLSQRGHASSFVLNPGARFGVWLAERGWPVHEVAMRNDMDLPACLRLRRLFKRSDADLIHLACSRSHKLGAHAALGLAGPPRVTTRRMDYPLPRSRYRRWLYGKAVAAVVCVSQGVREAVLATGADPGRVHVIHDGVDAGRLAAARAPERRAAARDELGLTEADVCGVTTASLHRRKGIDVLVRALREVRRPRDGRLVWVVAGDGPERAALGAAAGDLPEGVEVRFEGQVSDVEPLLAAADVFCLPSRKEGLGVALLEAMAAGLPVVGSAVGGMLESVRDGETGLLAAPGDHADLARAIGELLEDPGNAQALGLAARQRVQEHFSVDKMCNDTEALYASLVTATA